MTDLSPAPSAARRLLLAIAAFLALFLAGFRLIDDYDIWYHLTIGAEVLRLRGIPAAEFFLYPIMGEAASFHEWGFGLLFRLAQLLGGFPAMALANALLGSVTLMLLWRAAAVREEAELSGLLLLTPLFWLMEFRLVYRPEMMLFLALALTIYLLERWGRERQSRLLLPLPFITMALDWFHPSALFILGVMGFYGLQFLLEGKRAGQPLAPIIRPLATAAAIAAAASCLNPYGIRQLLLPLDFVQKGDYLALVEEFAPSLQSPFRWHFLAAAATAVILLACRRARLADALLLLCFGFLAFRYVRNIALFSLVLYLPAARALAPLTGRLPRRLSLATPLLLLAATAVLSLRSPAWGYGPASGLFPERCAALLEAASPPGRLFNSYESGGYLAWRLSGRYQAFIDGRHYAMDRTLRESNTILSASPEGQALMKRYGISAIITSPTFPGSGQLVPLVHELAQDPRWQMAAVEPGGVLFLRRDVLAGRPAQPDLPAAPLWLLALGQAEAVLAGDPGRTQALLTVATASLNLGNRPRALSALRTYVSLVPEDGNTALALATLEAVTVSP